MTDVSAYAWVGQHQELLEALSVTMVQPAGAGVVSRLEPKWEWPTRLTIAEALAASLTVDDYAWGSLFAQVDEIAGWTAIIEPNGWAASTPEMLAGLSADGAAMNVVWNVNALMGASVARNGVVIRQFDPLLYDASAQPLVEEAGLPFGEPGAPLRAASLAFLERLTGVRLSEQWLLGRSRQTFVVPVP